MKCDNKTNRQTVSPTCYLCVTFSLFLSTHHAMVVYIRRRAQDEFRLQPASCPGFGIYPGLSSRGGKEESVLKMLTNTWPSPDMSTFSRPQVYSSMSTARAKSWKDYNSTKKKESERVSVGSSPDTTFEDYHQHITNVRLIQHHRRGKAMGSDQV